MCVRLNISIRRRRREAEYKEILARQWLRWTGQSQDQEGDLLEALVEVSFRGGDLAYLHVKGRVTKSRSLPEQIFGVPAIAARIAGGGAFYINPKTIVRARIYHSMGQVEYPMGLWFAEAEDFRMPLLPRRKCHGAARCSSNTLGSVFANGSNR
jgi:hypothetical protein